MKKIIFCGVLIAILFIFIAWIGSGDVMWIDQEVKIDDRINCTYSVSTYLWYIEFWHCGIGASNHDFGVEKVDIDKIKQKQLLNILPYKKELKLALKKKC